MLGARIVPSGSRMNVARGMNSVPRLSICTRIIRRSSLRTRDTTMDDRAYARFLARFFHVHVGGRERKKSAYIAPTTIVHSSFLSFLLPVANARVPLAENDRLGRRGLILRSERRRSVQGSQRSFILVVKSLLACVSTPEATRVIMNN